MPEIIKNDIENQILHFEAIASKYFNARSNPRHLYLKDAIWKIFLCDIDDFKQKELNILEAMCGYAESYEIIKKISQTNFSFSAFDYSDNMIEYAKKLHPELKIFKQDVTTFCKPEEYDIIFLIGGLHHVYNYKELVLMNISKSLRPGGLFINFEPTNNNLILNLIRNIIYRNNNFFDEKTEKAFTTKELDVLIGGGGDM